MSTYRPDILKRTHRPIILDLALLTPSTSTHKEDGTPKRLADHIADGVESHEHLERVLATVAEEYRDSLREQVKPLLKF